MTIFERNTCPVCHSRFLKNFHHPAAGDTWKVKRCHACHFVFVANPPEVDFAAKHFPWEETMVNEKLRRERDHAPVVKKSRRFFARLKRATKAITRRDKVARLSALHFEKGPVLDIGCGDGSLVRSLPDGCVPWGIDLSVALAAEASARLKEKGGQAVCDDALNGLRGFPDGFFTGVLARSFLEHEIRPLEVLREIHRVLAPGGSVIIKVPNYASVNRLIRGDDWCGYRFPDHVNYFEPGHLGRLLDQAGLEIVRFGLKDYFPTSDNMWCVAKRPEISPEASLPGAKSPVPEKRRMSGNGHPPCLSPSNINHTPLKPSWLRRRLGKVAGIAATVVAAPEIGLAEAVEKRLLFVSGGSNTAGFLEGSNPQDRDEQRAEIDNFSNSSGNHGWGEPAEELEAAGYELVRMAEGAGASADGLNIGTPLPFDQMDLGEFAAIVMGSNNASYTANQIDALEDYVREGGGVVFISDANFGGSWEGEEDTGWQDASNSDQQFLNRFGLRMNHDRGTYAGRRTSGHFLVPDHPLLANDVDEIHGEGVTPVSRGTPVAGVHSEIIVRVPSDQDVGVNTPPFNNAGRGGSRDSTAADGVVAISQAGSGRVVGHFARNTFFNDGGAGSDITRYDNRRHALNLFARLTAGADLPAPANGWESWQRRYFNELDRANPTISGPDADPDDDGLPNWREALHGLDPHAADGDEPLSLFADIAGNQVRWRFRRGEDWDAASLNITRSVDLAEWTTLVPDEEVVVEEVPGGEWIEYRLTTAGGREFWRFEFDEAAAP